MPSIANNPSPAPGPISRPFFFWPPVVAGLQGPKHKQPQAAAGEMEAGDEEEPPSPEGGQALGLERRSPSLEVFRTRLHGPVPG